MLRRVAENLLEERPKDQGEIWKNVQQSLYEFHPDYGLIFQEERLKKSRDKHERILMIINYRPLVL